jgi:hypothetical protein
VSVNCRIIHSSTPPLLYLHRCIRVHVRVSVQISRYARAHLCIAGESFPSHSCQIPDFFTRSLYPRHDGWILSGWT